MDIVTITSPTFLPFQVLKPDVKSEGQPVGIKQTIKYAINKTRKAKQTKKKNGLKLS